MKKKIIALILLCGLLACTNISPALGADYGTAIVDGLNADRVHLRERASTGSNSLGLFFTGTQVLCESDPGKEWVKVTIGSQTGYMQSDYLYQGANPGSVKSKQPKASVTNKGTGSWVNLRKEPSTGAAVASKLYHGDAVTVLGQTVTKWYYVKAGDLYGYIMSDYLSVGASGSPDAPAYGTAVVDGRNADRVHLRERASTGANSLGLYFTGTKVLCESDPGKEWVKVTIGSQTGYMQSDYLYQGANPGSVKSKQPKASVTNKGTGSWVNLRKEPSTGAAVASKLYHGDAVTVLGQTVTKWYYVKAGDLYGYIMSDYLSVGASGSPDAPAYGTAVVDGRNADRVHLRERASTGANSLGLYFTGTKVLCESDPGKEWVKVTIGSQTGYMQSDYLYRGTNPGSIQSKQPKAAVTNKSTGSWVNLRKEPSTGAAVASKLYHGDAVTVLGETASHWYYVKAGELYGYIMSDFLSIGSSASGPSSKGYQMLLYTARPNQKSSIKIQYPKFTGAGSDSLNALIYAKVQSFAQDAYSLYSSDTGLTIDYQSAVTLHNRKIASMIFWGSSYVEGGNHPFEDLTAFNIDLSSMKEITFADLYTADGGFEQVFFKKAFFPTNPVTSYDAASFSEMLKLQTPEYESVSPFSYPDGVSCFLKPDGIVLSMGAVHATGNDHFEAQLRYGDIQQFYRLQQKYWEN